MKQKADRRVEVISMIPTTNQKERREILIHLIDLHNVRFLVTVQGKGGEMRWLSEASRKNDALN